MDKVDKMPVLMKPRLDSRLLGEIPITSDMQRTPPLWQKAKRNWRASWWKWKRRVKKLTWNSTFIKLKSWHLVPSLHGNEVEKQLGKMGKNKDGETMETVRDLIFLGSKSLWMVTLAMKIKDAYSLEEKLWLT